MSFTLTEDEIDDLLYFARAGEADDLVSTLKELATAKGLSSPGPILSQARDEHSGNSVLHMAAANGFTQLVTSVLALLPETSEERKAVLAHRNSSGNTPLHWAAVNGHLETVKALVDAGADVGIMNNAGLDAVFEAERGGKDEVVGWLLAKTAAGEGMDEEEGEDNGEESSKAGTVDEAQKQEETETTEGKGKGKERQEENVSSVEDKVKKIDINQP
ncbi:ankyrin [Xylona heveae TC161]|uniref:Ankyrin n=1 Tax=Xylona heveae (strain CBS 132557 / TC161) TaxID=1328760 RepID=A0A165ACL0_XYLHT|nr:ankyrin [Xylona heveae TC161]KZF20256.1 ankyrin [Xylona heveae TC161]